MHSSLPILIIISSNDDTLALVLAPIGEAPGWTNNEHSIIIQIRNAMDTQLVLIFRNRKCTEVSWCADDTINFLCIDAKSQPWQKRKHPTPPIYIAPT
jgi:hypothetical protein